MVLTPACDSQDNNSNDNNPKVAEKGRKGLERERISERDREREVSHRSSLSSGRERQK